MNFQMDYDASMSLRLLLSVVFGAVFLFVVVMSVVLHYHWTRYGMHAKILRLIQRVFFGVVAILLGGMATTLIFLFR